MITQLNRNNPESNIFSHKEENLQMFGPSNNFKKAQIGIYKGGYINWSQKISLSSKTHVGIQIVDDEQVYIKLLN